jgi:hypothetical protein
LKTGNKENRFNPKKLKTFSSVDVQKTTVDEYRRQLFDYLGRNGRTTMASAAAAMFFDKTFPYIIGSM